MAQLVKYEHGYHPQDSQIKLTTLADTGQEEMIGSMRVTMLPGLHNQGTPIMGRPVPKAIADISCRMIPKDVLYNPHVYTYANVHTHTHTYTYICVCVLTEINL